MARFVEKEESRDREGAKARSLRDLIIEMENEVLANAGVDVFEEVFKLVFTKLFDEMACHRGRYPYLRFRNSNTAAQLKEAIQALFNDAKQTWQGVFLDDERIRLSPDHLQVCVGSLVRFKNEAPPIWYLLAFMNSAFGRFEVEKWGTGQINPFLGLSNVKKISVPTLGMSQMTAIGKRTLESVQAAAKARNRSRDLLEWAQRAVELAIEDGEDVALAFLRQVKDKS